MGPEMPEEPGNTGMGMPAVEPEEEELIGPDIDPDEELENGDFEGMGPGGEGEDDMEGELNQGEPKPAEEFEDEDEGAGDWREENESKINKQEQARFGSKGQGVKGKHKKKNKNVKDSSENNEQKSKNVVNGNEVSSSSVAESVRKVTELKIKEASVRAERDKAIEELHTLQHVKEANENHKKVRSRLMERNKTLSAEVSGLRSVLETKAKNVSEAESQLEEAISKSKAIEDKVNTLDDDHKVEMEDRCNESFLEGKMSVLREYFGQRLRESRLKVHENVRALLGECSTLLEVDELIERLTKAKRRSAIHSDQITEIAVRKNDPKEDSEQRRVDEEVEEIFKGFGFIS
jgi:hypothetical protein